MRKIVSLAVLILLIWNQPSFAKNNWFKQESPAEQPAQPIEPKADKPIPNSRSTNKTITCCHTKTTLRQS